MTMRFIFVEWWIWVNLVLILVPSIPSTTSSRSSCSLLVLLASLAAADDSVGDDDESNTHNNENSTLQSAGALTAPEPHATLQGEFEGDAFWEEHGDLIRQAWLEYEQQPEPEGRKRMTEITATTTMAADGNSAATTRLPPLGRPQIAPAMRKAFETAWETALAEDGKENDKTSSSSSLHHAEQQIQSLWHPAAPGVWVGQLLDPDQCDAVGEHLRAAQAAPIPTRRPNGMNRHGLILSPVAGAVALTALNNFVQYLVDDYARPLGRMYFGEYVGKPEQKNGNATAIWDDGDSFAFTIHYEEGKDVKLSGHSDASLYTLNINLINDQNINDDDDNGTGSTLYFVGDNNDSDKRMGSHQSSPNNRQYYNISLTPGMAVLHRGLTRHGAWPLTTPGRRADGDVRQDQKRTNLVLWLFGNDPHNPGYVRVAPYPPHEQLRRPWERVQQEVTKNQAKTASATISGGGDPQRHGVFDTDLQRQQDKKDVHLEL